MMSPALRLALMLLPLQAFAAEPVISVVNEAQVPRAQLESILRDFRAYAARVYAYNHVAGTPVTLKLTRKVEFGFYQGGTVLLPPSDDRQAMIEDWVHELTHHATGHDSSFFFKEGIATHTLEAVLAQEHRVPQGWPNYGQSSDAWVSLYVQRKAQPPLAQALAWPGYQGDSPENDFRSWQVYNLGASFAGWYIQTRGYEAFRAAFKARAPKESPALLEKPWLDAVLAKNLPGFDPAKALPDRERYRGYVERLQPPAQN